MASSSKPKKAKRVAADVGQAVKEAGAAVVDKAVHAADSLGTAAGELVRDSVGSASEPQPDPRVTTGTTFPAQGPAQASAALEGAAVAARGTLLQAADIFRGAAQAATDHLRSVAQAQTAPSSDAEIKAVAETSAGLGELLSDSSAAVAEALAAISDAVAAAIQSGSAQEAGALMEQAQTEAETTMAAAATRAHMITKRLEEASGQQTHAAVAQDAMRSRLAAKELRAPDPADKFILRDTAGDVEDHDIDLRETVAAAKASEDRELWLDPLEETAMDPTSIDVPRI